MKRETLCFVLFAHDRRQRSPDITLAREKLKWEPKVALDQGLARTIEYFDGLLRSNRQASRVGRQMQETSLAA